MTWRQQAKKRFRIHSIVSIGASDQAVISGITFTNNSGNEDQVIFKMEGFFPPEVFGLEGENPRVVCDFLNTRLGNAVHRLLEANGNFIQRVRVGIHGSASPKIRVVLDLVPKQRFDIQQVFAKKDNQFTIIVRPAQVRSENPRP
jgi:hypothetical protein